MLDYFEVWIVGGTSKAAAGWRQDYVRNYGKYVQPVNGGKSLLNVKPADIANVLARAEAMGRGPQTRLHIYNLMHKMFGDAVEDYQILGSNPVKRSYKPVVPKKEALYLTVDDASTLLLHVAGKPCEVAIWLNLYVGMRVGEIQSLRCKDIDLVRGTISINSTYVRKEKRIQDYPKGKEDHTVKMPPELFGLIRNSIRGRQASDFVASASGTKMLSYAPYLRALKKYCVQSGVREVATHGLRHSTSEIYLAHGATRDDLYHLFKHSSLSVTERYMHDKGERVHKIAQVICLFNKTKHGSTLESGSLTLSSSDVAQNVAPKEQITSRSTSKIVISS